MQHGRDVSVYSILAFSYNRLAVQLGIRVNVMWQHSTHCIVV